MSLTKVTYSMIVAAPIGVVTAGTELSTLVAQAGGLANRLEVNQNVVVTSNTTIPATLAVSVVKGATISIANGVTLTINGYFDCGLYQAFAYTGTGRVKFASGSIPQVYPEWFTSDVTVASNCMQHAYDSLPDNGGCIYITSLVVMSSTLVCDVALKVITIRGSSVFKADLRYDGSGGVIRFINGADCRLENFSINTAASADDAGILIDGCYRCVITRISMQTRGLYITSTQFYPPLNYAGVYWCTFENIKAKWMWLDNAYGGTAIAANTFISCTTVFYNGTTNAGLTLGTSNGSADGCNTNTFIGCDFSYALGGGSVYAVSVGLYCDHNTFIGTYIEQATNAIYNRGYDTSFIGGQINGGLTVTQAAQGNFSIYTIDGGSRTKTGAFTDISSTTQYTLANNTAISFTDVNIYGLLQIISTASANSGIVHIWPGNNSCTALAVGANIDTSSAVLTGTTGTVGKLTVSGNSGTTYIENRTGGSISVSIVNVGVPANVS